MFKFFLLAACVATCFATSIPFDPCYDSQTPNPELLPAPVSINIAECPGIPCGFAIGQNVTVVINVYVDKPVTTIPVFTSIQLGNYGFALDPFEGCSHIAVGCPKTAGHYNLIIPTTLEEEGVVAGEEVVVRMRFNDDIGGVIACASVTTTFV